MTETTSSHWYTMDGEPMHLITKKDGTTRPTTLRDARKLNLLPSVTGILNVLGKPGLSRWREQQMALAGHALAKGGMDERQWLAAVQEKAFKSVDEAASLGSLIHDALESATAGEKVAPDLRTYVDPVLSWMADRDIKVREREAAVVSKKHGYAGKADLFFTWGDGDGKGILDYKTRRTTPERKIAVYDGQGMQLAAYAAAHYGEQALPDVLAANMIISTTEPGRIEVVKHEDLVAEFEAFESACTLWRHMRAYDPRVCEDEHQGPADND